MRFRIREPSTDFVHQHSQLLSRLPERIGVSTLNCVNIMKSEQCSFSDCMNARLRFET